MPKRDDCDWTLAVDWRDIRGLTLEERRRLGLSKSKNKNNRTREGSGGNLSVGARVLRAMWSMRGGKKVKKRMKKNVANNFEFDSNDKFDKDVDIVRKSGWKGKGKEKSALERGKRKGPNHPMSKHGEQEGGPSDSIKRVAHGALNGEDEVLSCESSSAIPDKGTMINKGEVTSHATSIVPYGPLAVPDEVIPSNAGYDIALPDDEVGPKLLLISSVNVEHDDGKQVQDNSESDDEINAKDLDQLDQTVRFALAYLKSK